MTKVLTEQKKYKRNPHYLSNDDLLKEIIISKQQNKLTDKAVNMLMLMTKKLNSKFKYKDEDDRADVLQYSYLVLLKNWKNFNEEKYTNCFAYFSEVIKRAQAMQFNNLNKTRKNSISINNFFNDGEDMNI